MESFLLRIILCCLLFINVTYCIKCYDSICKANCYYKNKGHDYGYCENGSCKCASPEIYLFDGRNYSDKQIDNPMSNDKVIQNSVSRSSTSDILNNKYNEIWEKIAITISIKYPFFKGNLNSLKSMIFDNWSYDINYLYLFLNNPLENALAEMKKKKPSTSKKCEEFLRLLSRDISKIKPIDFKNGSKGTSSIGINIRTQNNNQNPNRISKSNINQTEMDKDKHEILIVLSEETVEYDDSDEEYFEQNKKNVHEKIQIQNKNNYRNVVKLPQIDNEKNDNKLTLKK